MLNFFRNWRRKTQAVSVSDGLPFRVAPEVKASRHANGMVLIHTGTGTVFSANRVGALIWNSAVEHRSLEQLATAISTEFHVSPQVAEHDATEFLAQLKAEGLLVADAS